MDRYRAVLEVAKCSTGRDILQSYHSVAHVWLDVCRSEELWREVVDRREDWEQWREPGENSAQLYRRMTENRVLVWAGRREIKQFDCRTHQ